MLEFFNQMGGRGCWFNQGVLAMSPEASPTHGSHRQLWTIKDEAKEASGIASACRAQLFRFGPEHLARPPQAIASFVERAILHSKYYEGPDSRTEPRYPVQLRVAAVPVDENLERTGEPFMAVSRDISGSGIAIYHTRGVTDKWLALELTTPSGEKMHVVLEILRCRPVGLFYEIAGKFVSKFTA